MKVQSNYMELLLIRNDINSNLKTSPAFRLFNIQKINSFFKNNIMRINIADEKLREMQQKFIKHDDQGEPVKIETKGDLAMYEYNSDEDKIAYHALYNEFMKRDIILEI